MKLIAFNGGPRKHWNTAALLEKVLEGAESQGAQTELIHLYDLDFKGCISCFNCKLKNGKSYGHCAVDDDLKPIFKKVEEADALVFGSPIYLSAATGVMRSFLERLVFQYLVYDGKHSSLLNKRLPSVFFYTMGMPESSMKKMGYPEQLGLTQTLLSRVIGESVALYVTDTLQFDDYSKYVSSAFDPVEKAKRHDGVFPEDCKKAFDMGVKLLSSVG
jgi:multimeric flavodoxin WrbA